MENLDSGIGLYAPDAEAYSVFAPLFDPVIGENNLDFLLKIFSKIERSTTAASRALTSTPLVTSEIPPSSEIWTPRRVLNVPRSLSRPSLQGQFVVSTRIRCGRSVQGFPFNPNMTEQQYSQLERTVSDTLQVSQEL